MPVDIRVYEHLVPRLIEILADTDATVQEIHDALRAWEDSPGGMGHERLIDSAGKEDLGGGVSVGITSTLQNAKVGFQPRTASKSEGTCTTADSGTKLIDSTATFISDGVTVGATIVNFTDRSVATVISIDSEIQLTHLALADGTDDQWETGDGYKVWNVVQCDLEGGNLVAVDEGGAAMSSVWPTAFTQIVRTSASSGTISNLEIENLQRLIEMLRAHHTGTGDIWYWDPYGGDDENTGASRLRPVKTFARAQEVAADNNHDIVFCIPGDPSGTTVAVENLEITKNYLFVRGPGRDFRIIPSDDTKPAVKFASGVEGAELSGCVVESAPSGSQPVILIDGANFVLVENVWAGNGVAEGIKVVESARSILRNCIVQDCAADGIHLGDGITELTMDAIHVEGCVGDGIDFVGAGIAGVSLSGHCEIHDNDGYGIRIGSGTTRTCLVASELDLSGNTLGDLLDNGTGTDVCGELEREHAADAVWDEDLAPHEAVVGSVAEALALVADSEGGRWLVVDTTPFPQLVLLKKDNLTEIRRFDLKAKDGTAIDLTKVLVHDRVVVP